MKQVMHEAIKRQMPVFHNQEPGGLSATVPPRKGDYLPKKGPERYFEPRTANIRQHQQQQFYNDNQL